MAPLLSKRKKAVSRSTGRTKFEREVLAMSAVENDVCDLKHERLEDKLNTHDSRLNNHSDRLDRLEQYQARSEQQIKNLCDDIKSLVDTLKAQNRLVVTSLLGIVGALSGFVIWYIQTL